MRTIRDFILILAACLLASTVQAAPPQTIGYQGYLTSNTGVPVTGSASVIFSLYSVATGGAAIWTETQPTVAVSNGNYSVLLGSVAPIALPFDAPYWLGVKVGTDTEMAPRAALASVPYAFRAVSVDSAATISGAQVTGPVASATTAGSANTAVTAVNLLGLLTGDVTGQQGSTTLSAIRGSAVSATAPADGQVLIFRSGQWQPAADVANLLASVAALQGQMSLLRFPRAYVANSLSGNVSVIDTSNNTVIATIPTGSFPYGVAIANGITRGAYVVNKDSNSVSVIDTRYNIVVATASVGLGPRSIAIDGNESRAYVTNGDSGTVSVIALDGGNYSVLATVTVGSLPIGVALNAVSTRAYVANLLSNNVSVINTASNIVVATVPVGSGPFGVALNPSGTRAYVTNQNSNNVSVIDTSSNTVVATVTVGTNPIGVVLNPGGTRAYVANFNSNLASAVSVIDTASNIVVATVPVGSGPYGITVNPSGSRVYVTNVGSGTVSAIDTATNAVVATTSVGTNPNGIAVR